MSRIDNTGRTALVGVISILAAAAFVFPAISSASFSSPVNYSLGTNPNGITVADFNEDGVLDVAAANADTDNVTSRLGVGDGTFGAARTFAVGDAPSSLAVGDFNKDGFADLAVANGGTSDNVSILRKRIGTLQCCDQLLDGEQPRFDRCRSLRR